MTYLKINSTIYPATFAGKMNDSDWDNRESKSITLEAPFDIVDEMFVNNAQWSIISENIVFVVDEDGNEVSQTQQFEYDNSKYCIRGDLIVHVDGTCTVKMGKLTELEEAYEIILGGI